MTAGISLRLPVAVRFRHLPSDMVGQHIMQTTYEHNLALTLLPCEQHVLTT